MTFRPYYNKSSLLEYLHDIANFNEQALPFYNDIIKTFNVEQNDRVSPYQALWRGVFAYNASVALGWDYQTNRSIHEYEAEQWVNSRDFNLICDLADIDISLARTRLNHLLEEKAYYRRRLYEAQA